MNTKRRLLGLTLAAIMLCSLFVVCASTSVAANPLPSGASPNACADDKGIALFVKGYDNKLWFKRWSADTKAWTAWKQLGPELLGSDPAAVSPSLTKMDVFVRGTDGNLYMKSSADYGVTWTGWVKPGGVVEKVKAGTAPAVTGDSSKDGRMWIFWADSSSGALTYKRYNPETGYWSAKTSLGGTCASSPAVTWYVTSQYSTWVAFVKGTTGYIYYQDPAKFSGWKQVNEKPKAGTGPAVSSRPESVDLAWVSSSDSKLKTKNYNGGAWGATTSLGGICTSSPSSVNSGWIAIFVRNTEGDISRHMSGVNWGTSTFFGSGRIAGPP